MWLKVRIGTTIFAILLIALSLVLSLYLFPYFVKNRIADTVKLENGTDGYARWERLPIPIQYKIYFFNISNPDKVQHGAKPVVQEIGPYVYNQERFKSNINQDEDRLSYFQNLDFEFDSNASYPLTDTDSMTIVNLPLMALVSVAERRVFPLLPLLDTAINDIFGNPKDLFLRTTPKDFLFDGVFLACDNNDTIVSATCRIIEKLAPPTLRRLDDGRFKFSLLTHKNDSGEGDFIVNSGTNDIEMLGEITNWQGSSTLNKWKENSTCDKIVGTDATIYPPGLKPESQIRVFSVDICRSVTLEYEGDTEYRGIFGHRYTAGKNMLASPKSLTSNDCYCLNVTRGLTTSHHSDGCLLDGAMELTPCQGAPIVLTLPHFYLAHDVYQNGVEGLNPQETLHEMYVDLEPNTGSPLRGHKKAQFNIFLRPIENITITQTLDTTLVPVVWLDEGVELNDEFIEELNRELFNILKMLDIVQWTLLGVGVAIICINIIWWLLECCKKKSNH